MKKQTNVVIVTISVFIATFMTAIEGTIVSTAMPTIIGSLHGMEIMNWVFSIYLLTSAMLTPIYGKLADKIGRKPVFIAGTFIFILGSFLCGLSQNMMFLIVARGIQGIGAGAILPVSLTIIGDIYPVEKRAKILGLNTAAWGIASVFGPLTGGFIVDTIGWHWIFMINVPIGLIVIALITLFLVEEKREAEKVPMDIKGSLLLMTTLLTLLLGFQFFGSDGLSWKTLLSLALAVISLIIFIFEEKKAADPVVDLALFKNSMFVIVNMIAVLYSGFLIGVEVYIPMWMQGVLGKSAALGGLVLAPMSILWTVGSLIAGNLMVKQTIKRVLIFGLSIIFIGSLGLSAAPLQLDYLWFWVISAILGIGFGVVATTVTVSAQSSVDASKMGVATSFNVLVRTIGQTIMVSVFGVLMNTITQSKIESSDLAVDADLMNQLVNPHTASEIPAQLLAPLKGILYSGLHMSYVVGSMLMGAAIILTFLFKEKKRQKEQV